MLWRRGFPLLFTGGKRLWNSSGMILIMFDQGGFWLFGGLWMFVIICGNMVD